MSHPVRFFEVLPKVPDVRAPGLFLVFSSILSAVVWFFFGGIYAALAALVLPIPLSLALAGLWHLGSWGGRYGYVVTWRTVVYPFGFSLPLVAVPIARWIAVAYAGVVLLSVGTATVREVSAARSLVISVAITAVVGAAILYTVGPL
ncbi:MAG: hypothetical protein ACRDSJ_00575 [Rubrobacteraceae bacterium]